MKIIEFVSDLKALAGLMWYEVRVKYDKVLTDGLVKSVSEIYAEEAYSFTDAEDIITKKAKDLTKGDFAIKSIKEAAYKIVFVSNKQNADRWYKVKVRFLSENENSAKKYTYEVYLIQSRSASSAIENLEIELTNRMQKGDIVDINKTNIITVFEHKKK